MKTCTECKTYMAEYTSVFDGQVMCLPCARSVAAERAIAHLEKPMSDDVAAKIFHDVRCVTVRDAQRRIEQLLA